MPSPQGRESGNGAAQELDISVRQAIDAGGSDGDVRICTGQGLLLMTSSADDEDGTATGIEFAMTRESRSYPVVSSSWKGIMVCASRRTERVPCSNAGRVAGKKDQE
jgi:hypothetical protein